MDYEELIDLLEIKMMEFNQQNVQHLSMILEFGRKKAGNRF